MAWCKVARVQTYLASFSSVNSSAAAPGPPPPPAFYPRLGGPPDSRTRLVDVARRSDAVLRPQSAVVPKVTLWFIRGDIAPREHFSGE